ncbi:MAG: DUF1329 domain-containing protein [Nevskiales bacterium]
MNSKLWVRAAAYSLTAAFALAASASYAKAPPEEADKLKNGTLTPSGADPNANADNSIPKWEGGLRTPPAGYKGPPERFPNVFPDDKPLFTITKENMEQYKDKLSVAHIALFNKYPKTYKMNVYESKRTFANPDFVYEWNHKNALNAELTNEGNGFQGAAIGIPFPIPKEGVDPVWNHKSRYRGESGRRWNIQTPVTVGGDYNPSVLQEDFWFWYNQKDMTPDRVGNLLVYFMQVRHAPAIIRGEVLLVHEMLDQIAEPRKAWLYNPGQRRVRLAPNVGHDNPGTGADGLRTNDQTDTFNGSLERYTWKLVGKKEVYIPYNAGEIHQAKYKYKDLVRKGHLNQDPARYELHRVWVVDSEVRPGTSHIYGRRTFYIDEDSWQMAVVDVYDKRGQLWRAQEAHSLQSINPQSPDINMGTGSILESIYDLQSSRYLLQAMNNEHDETVAISFDKAYFTTGNMKSLAPK